MNSHIIPYDSEAYRFKTISEFKTSMRYGAEVVIEWQDQEYGIWSENGMIRITRPEVRYLKRLMLPWTTWSATTACGTSSPK